ncbi:hypothetical protein Tsp_04521 [Trichinella spiralis]|uniref:hypothetical protein n=1 Tax=Trichinella spiralis TaxID=6334 RepID=UPI0001EFEED7|nr:hypothetical protein Tsp_04521 [Trichinella spiralis]
MLVTFCSPVNRFTQFGLVQTKFSPPFLTGHLTFSLTASAVHNSSFTFVLKSYCTAAWLDAIMKRQFALRTQNTYRTTIFVGGGAQLHNFIKGRGCALTRVENHWYKIIEIFHRHYKRWLIY